MKKLIIPTILLTGGITLGAILEKEPVKEPVDKQVSYISVNEWQESVAAWNEKIDSIKANCKNDIRCREVGGQKTVRFEDIGDKRDIVIQLQKWVKESDILYEK